MQKSTSTILIAFLAGLVVAGGIIYVVSTLRSKPAAPPPAVQTAAVQPVTQTASPAPVPPPESALAHEPAALAEPPAAVPQNRPAVAKRETPGAQAGSYERHRPHPSLHTRKSRRIRLPRRRSPRKLLNRRHTRCRH